MKKLTLLTLAIALTAFPRLSVAEDRSFLGDHKRFFQLLSPEHRDLKISGLYQPNNDEKNGGGGSFDLTELAIQTEVPVPLEDDFYLRFGGDYSARLYDFVPVRGSTTAESSNTLHKLSLSAGAGLFLSDNLLLTGIARPGIYSDFEEFDQDSFRLFGEGMLVYQINPGSQLLGGVSYDEVFDDTPFYPFVGARFLNEDGTLKVTVTFPREARIGYFPIASTELYLGTWVNGDEYNITAGRRKGFDAHVHEKRAGGGITYYASDVFSFQLEGGVVYDNKLEYKIPGAGQYENDLDTTGYAKVGMGITF